jgi:hypothetical protein
MLSKKKLVKELKKLSQKFLEPKRRKALLISLKGDKTKWFLWTSQMKGVLKNLDRAEAIKFSGLLLLLEKNPSSRLYQDKMKKFLIDKIEFYKYYDFSLEKKLAEKKITSKNLWTSKILRLFISRSFLGILILFLILGFIAWFYLDRESCLEFVKKVIQPFLKSIH